MECKHEDAECTVECECICDGCQTSFEKGWLERVTKENLCFDCGTPKTLTVAALLETQYTHFFQPCVNCAPAVKACLVAANLCETCREPLLGAAECTLCFCEETETCACRQCTTFRASRETGGGAQ